VIIIGDILTNDFQEAAFKQSNKSREIETFQSLRHPLWT